MKCPENASVCEVRKIGESNDTFGQPPTAREVYYRCAVHGFFIHMVENNGATRPDWGKLNRDITELKAAHQ